MKKILLCFFIFMGYFSFCQSIEQRLGKAYNSLVADPQFRNAIIGFSVFDSKNNKIVFERNANIGLAPASTQKIITSVAAFELLGKEYRFKTALSYLGVIKEGRLNGNLYLSGSGDPTLGSWRWPGTRDSLILKKWLTAVKSVPIKEITGPILFDGSKFSYQSIPDGWIWQDIGNYYGAGAFVLNWKENQFELTLQSENNKSNIIKIISSDTGYVNELSAGEKGSGDNAFAYLPIGAQLPLLKGTIPMGESSFTISLAERDPIKNLIKDIGLYLESNGVSNPTGEKHSSISSDRVPESKPTIISTHFSPSLDSICYPFLRKSINLYGEALIKAIAYEKDKWGSTEKGIELVKDFYFSKGINKSAINIIDGSGLSPQNRVTANALVSVLQYAKTRSWFSFFYNAIPEYNGLKMKSGSINGVRAFAGYQKATKGKEYTFCLIINNFNGPVAEVVQKMYKLLDILK
ncbi:MAG: D-alanyl-D-alanine carboxypeptidase/D-alanyl-D-alanine-endopeptidase [Chitinophagaceae bacterium]